MFRQKLRRLPVLGSVYAIIAALGLVVLAVGVIGVAAVYTTNKHVRELEEVANRAFFAEHANTLVYAVVMDSRGIYMSADAPDRATYGAGVMKFLAELDATMAALEAVCGAGRSQRFCTGAGAGAGVHPVPH